MINLKYYNSFYKNFNQTNNGDVILFSIDREYILTNIEKLKDASVLVVGDLAIDEMIYGDTERISREAPVLILRYNRTKIILGGGSNAAHNIATLNNGKVGVIGVIGEDYHAPILINAFKEVGIDTQYLVTDKARFTTVKTRISGSCSHSITQQIVRMDRQTTTPISKETEDKVIKNLELAIPNYDAVILSDYHLGTLTQRVIDSAIQIAKKYNKVITVDAQKDLHNYKGVTALTPNQPDTEKFVGYFINDEETLVKAGKDSITKTQSDMVLITRGDKGMVLFERNEKVTRIPVFNKKDVFDVTGAGDTVVATFTLALASGFKPKYAAVVGNIAASIVVRHFGCATTTIGEIVENLNKMDMDKFIIGG